MLEFAYKGKSLQSLIHFVNLAFKKTYKICCLLKSSAVADGENFFFPHSYFLT